MTRGAACIRPARCRLMKTCKRGHVRESGSCKTCSKASSLMRTYGLTIDEYVAMWTYQGGKCGICHKPIMISIGGKVYGAGGLRSEIDHRHITGKAKFEVPKKHTVRGLMCGGRYKGCNKRLGHVDDVSWLRGAERYVANPPAYHVLV